MSGTSKWVLFTSASERSVLINLNCVTGITVDPLNPGTIHLFNNTSLIEVKGDIAQLAFDLGATLHETDAFKNTR